MFAVEAGADKSPNKSVVVEGSSELLGNDANEFELPVAWLCKDPKGSKFPSVLSVPTLLGVLPKSANNPLPETALAALVLLGWGFEIVGIVLIEDAESSKLLDFAAWLTVCKLFVKLEKGSKPSLLEEGAFACGAFDVEILKFRSPKGSLCFVLAWDVTGVYKEKKTKNKTK